MPTAFWRGDTLIAKYKDATGKWVWEATSYEKKGDAKRYAAQMEAMHHEVRAGIREAPMDATKDFAWLHAWWWERYGKRHRARKRDDFEAMFENRVLRHLGATPLDKLSPLSVLEALKKNEERQVVTGKDGRELVMEPIAPKTLNHLRSRISTIIQRASIRGGPWRGAPNPVTREEVPRWKVGKKIKDTLRPEEVGPTLAALDDGWQPLFATAIWMGLRKGELASLEKPDVRLERAGFEELDVSKSWDSSSTKTDDEGTLPIPAPLVPYLRRAMATSRCNLVFPAPSGGMMHEDTKLQLVLRRAMARAGFTKGWVHTCRRCKAAGAPHEEQHSDSGLRHCPACHMKLWPKPIHRDIDFHGLRRTTATLLAKAGVPTAIAQKICRHADIEVTASIYTQVDQEDMRSAMNRIAVGGANLGAPVVRLSETQKHEGSGHPIFASETGAFEVSGRQDLNLRPLGPENSASGWQGVAGHGSESQPADIPRATIHALPRRQTRKNTKTEILGAPVVRSSRSKTEPTTDLDAKTDGSKVGTDSSGGDR